MKSDAITFSRRTFYYQADQISPKNKEAVCAFKISGCKKYTHTYTNAAPFEKWIKRKRKKWLDFSTLLCTFSLDIALCKISGYYKIKVKCTFLSLPKVACNIFLYNHTHLFEQRNVKEENRKWRILSFFFPPDMIMYLVVSFLFHSFHQVQM